MRHWRASPADVKQVTHTTPGRGCPIRILVVGGGCAGMSAALGLQHALGPRLRSGQAEITVVEPQPYLTYHPLLAEVAAGTIDPRHVVVPLRRVLPDCRVLTARISRIDHATRRAWVDTAPRGEAGSIGELRYDHLVMAPGSVSRTDPVPGLAEHGLGFAGVGEAVALRNHVLEQLDLASSTRDPELRQAALTFVFVGAGYAGIGALAELEDMARFAVRGYHNLAPDDLRWVLVEATGRILPAESPDLAEHTLAELRERSIDVRLGTTLESAVDRVMTLSDGSRFAARTLVWTAGVRPSPFWSPPTCRSTPPAGSAACPRCRSSARTAPRSRGPGRRATARPCPTRLRTACCAPPTPSTRLPRPACSPPTWRPDSTAARRPRTGPNGSTARPRSASAGASRTPAAAGSPAAGPGGCTGPVTCAGCRAATGASGSSWTGCWAECSAGRSSPSAPWNTPGPNSSRDSRNATDSRTPPTPVTAAGIRTRRADGTASTTAPRPGRISQTGDHGLC
ncbi:hypothetical protein GCM10025734_47720 [Kitasatospora paranensis]